MSIKQWTWFACFNVKNHLKQKEDSKIIKNENNFLSNFLKIDSLTKKEEESFTLNDPYKIDVSKLVRIKTLIEKWINDW